MNGIVVGLGVVIALAAAARSTWSPCGLSMLSQITPVAEAARRQRFARTACWFIGGAVLGGVTLGAAMAGLAALASAAGLGENTAIAVAAACAFVSATIDTRLLGFGPPFLRRQVNEDWLGRYRSWLYGSGFGWQIGVGFATYIMTTAVVLTVVLGALSASPAAALGIGFAFGLARGLAVLLGAPVRTLPALYSFHRRFDAAAEPVREAVIGTQLAVAIIASWMVAPAAVAAVVSVGAVGLAVWTRRHATQHADAPVESAGRSAPPAQRQAVA